MANKIALTASMRSNLLSLKNTQSLLDKTQDHLSTGYKVNSAMDNPSSYFTAQALNSRANDLSTLLDGIGQAISTLEVADKGITTSQDFVEQAKSIAQSARDTSNVSANVASNVRFDLDTLRSELVTNTVNGVAANDTMKIRVGDSTKLTGTSNVRDDAAIGTGGFGLTGANVGILTVDGTQYDINASTTTEKMTTATFEYNANDKLVVSNYDGTAGTMTLTDADGNVFEGVSTGGVSFVDGETATHTGDFSISATITADGKTEWQVSAALAADSKQGKSHKPVKHRDVVIPLVGDMDAQQHSGGGNH